MLFIECNTVFQPLYFRKRILFFFQKSDKSDELELSDEDLNLVNENLGVDVGGRVQLSDDEDEQLDAQERINRDLFDRVSFKKKIAIESILNQEGGESPDERPHERDVDERTESDLSGTHQCID